MLELKRIEADPHNKLMDFTERGDMTRRAYFSAVIRKVLWRPIEKASKQLQAGRDLLNPQASGALILINDEFPSLRREGAARLIAQMLRDPNLRVDLVFYIQEVCDADPLPGPNPVQLFEIWGRAPSSMDLAYANFLGGILRSIVHFSHERRGKPRLRVYRDGRVLKP